MINIAIDGPASSGKSTLAKNLAAKYNFLYLDTGAMYRGIALHMQNKSINVEDEVSVINELNNVDMEIKYIDGIQKLFLNTKDVSLLIRANEISMLASTVSKIPEVRIKLVKMQQDIAKGNNCILDGRDIGTHVLPNAQIKIFLVASAEERARRRFAELTEQGEKIEYDILLEEIKQRDYQDSNRKFAPLKQANDAILVDTSKLSIDETFNMVSTIIDKVIGKK